MEDSFIDKVFDAYLKSDYSYGDDNLNPKREITKDTAVDTNDELEKILEGVHNKIQAIGKKYKDPINQKDVSLNLNDDGKNVGTRKVLDLIPSEDENEPGYSGTTGAADGIESALIEIDNIIPKILMSIYPPIPELGTEGASNGEGLGDDEDGKEPLPIPYPPPTDFEQPNLYKIDCYGTIDIISGKDNSMPNDTEDNEGVESDENAKSSDSSSSDASSSEALSEARDKFLHDTASQIDRNNASAKECALADLKILKMISAVLRILRGIKSLIDNVINPAMETCQIIVLAAQSWLNPTSVNEILNRILQKVQTILIMVSCKLLQLLWNLLGLDCITSQVQSIVVQIKALLSGINSIFSEVNRTALNLGNSFDKLEDSFSEANAAFSEALEYSVSDRIRDTFELDEMAAGISTFDESFREGLRDGVMNTDAYKSVMETIDLVKSIGQAKKDVAKFFTRLKSKDSEVNKFVSRFNNIKSK